MQVRREPVSQLARVSRQVDVHLLQLVRQHAGGRLVAAELAAHEPLPLLGAAYDRPHQEVRHVDGHRLRQARELGRVAADDARVALSAEWEDLETADFLSAELAHA